METMRSGGKRRAGLELDEVKENEGVYEKIDKRNVDNHTYENLKTEKKTKTYDIRHEDIDKIKVVTVLLCVVVVALVVAAVTVSSVVFFGVTDGGWTSWGDWGACSVTCGGGLITRSRTCSSPQPTSMGKYCDGISEQVKICNNYPCSGSGIGFSVYNPNKTPGGNPLTFRAAVYNNGDVFNMTSGTFVCMQEGLYLFINTILRMRNKNKRVRCFFYKNDTKNLYDAGYADSADTGVHPSGTNSILYHLKPGDRVYLGSCSGVSYIDSSSSFTGILISPFH